jgi:hypothetical protein
MKRILLDLLWIGAFGAIIFGAAEAVRWLRPRPASEVELDRAAFLAHEAAVRAGVADGSIAPPVRDEPRAAVPVTQRPVRAD